MNLRKLTLKYMGWCPGVKAAAEFTRQGSPPRALVYRVLVISSLALVLGVAVVSDYAQSTSPLVHLAHYEDVTGDAIIPYIDPEGTALGGLDHLGADIVNVTLYSLKKSDELTVTARLNGKGRGDPTIDVNRTRIHFEFDRDVLGGYGILYYNGEGRAGGWRDGRRYDAVTEVQWINDNEARYVFKGLRGMTIDWVTVTTERRYLEEAEVEYWPYLLQQLDTLTIEDYMMSRGTRETVTDATNQLYPLFNASMIGADIHEVDVYRKGRRLNVTVTMEEPKIAKVPLPSTFQDFYSDIAGTRCDVSVHMRDDMFWQNVVTCASYSWIEQGRKYCITFDIGELHGLENVDVIEVVTCAQFFPTVSGEIVDGGLNMWWYFDVIAVPFNEGDREP